LKPDIVVRSFRSGQPLAVLDAKYKTTIPSTQRPSGVYREDLYQLNAYLSAFGNIDNALIGGLVYPADALGRINHLQASNVWRTGRTGLPFCFFGIDNNGGDSSGSMTTGEAQFVKSVGELIDLRRPRTS